MEGGYDGAAALGLQLVAVRAQQLLVVLRVVVLHASGSTCSSSRMKQGV